MIGFGGWLGRLLIAGAALLALAMPALAQAAKPIAGLEDGTYYVHGRKMSLVSDDQGGMKFKMSDGLGGSVEIIVSPNKIVRATAKSPIGLSGMSTTGFASANGFQTSDFFVGRAPDGNFYYLNYFNYNGRFKILRFSRLVPESEANALVASRASEIKDQAAIEQLIGCSVANLARCIVNTRVDLAANTLPDPKPGLAKPAAVADGVPAATGPRLALVVANSAYTGAMGRLANPVNDARAVSAALRQAQFEVTVVTEADQRAMKRAIVAFGARLAAAGRDATALFYYAGHGVQARGANYLIPVGAMIDAESDVDIEAVQADAVLRQMEQPNVATSIVVLDACRNLPLQRSTRADTRGLARMDAPSGAFIAYSTAPGQVAYDGTGGNSAFAKALASEMLIPGQAIEATFRNVRRAVMAATGGKQTPWDNSSLVNGFAFKARP